MLEAIKYCRAMLYKFKKNLEIGGVIMTKIMFNQNLYNEDSFLLVNIVLNALPQTYNLNRGKLNC